MYSKVLEIVHSISAANGSGFSVIPFGARLESSSPFKIVNGSAPPPRGWLRRVASRITAAPSWTFTSWRTRVLDGVTYAASGTGAGFPGPNEHQLFDSGAIVAGLGGSNTVPVFDSADPAFVPITVTLPQPVGLWPVIGWEWATSAGAGTTLVVTTLTFELEDGY